MDDTRKRACKRSHSSSTEELYSKNPEFDLQGEDIASIKNKEEDGAENNENSQKSEEDLKEETASGSASQNSHEESLKGLSFQQYIEEERHYLENIDLFTSEQKDVLEYVKKLLTDEKFYLTNPTALMVVGPVGTGKTELLKTLCDYTENELNQEAIFVASSGVAALEHKKGRTAHSKFNFPLDMEDIDEEAVKNHTITNYNETISGASLIVYDEVNMTNQCYIHLLDKSLQKLMNNNKIFGGKVMVFSGDFCQVAPVLTGLDAYTEQALYKASPQSLDLWKQLKCFSLSTPERMSIDTNYMTFVMGLTSQSGEYSVPLTDIKHTFDLEDFINFVYPPDVINDPDKCAKRAILDPQNEVARRINNYILDRLDGETYTFVSGDQYMKKEKNVTKDKITLENYLASEELQCEDIELPETELELKKGCLCMFIRNVYSPTTLLNGAKVVVVDIIKNQGAPECLKIRKVGEKEPHYIIEKQPFEQFPLKLCYATTIHKSQGHTFDKIGVNLTSPVWTHGQLYLAFGRVRSRADIKVLIKKRNTKRQLKQDEASKTKKVAWVTNIHFKSLVPAIQAPANSYLLV